MGRFNVHKPHPFAKYPVTSYGRILCICGMWQTRFDSQLQFALQLAEPNLEVSLADDH